VIAAFTLAFRSRQQEGDMGRLCGSCHSKVDDDRLVACPNCGGVLTADAPRNNILQLEEKREIINEIWKRLWKWLIGGLSIIALGSFLHSGFTLDKLYNQGIEYVRGLLISRVEAEFQTEKISETVQRVAESQAKKMIKEEISPSIEAFQIELNIELLTTKEATQFNLLVTKAFNDNRSAFDELKNIAEGKGQFRDLATNAIVTIADEFDTSIRFPVKLNWEKINLRPESCSLEEYYRLFSVVHNRFKTDLVVTLWEQNRFDLSDRLEFLYSAIKNSESLRTLHKASMLMNKEAKLDLNIVAYENYLYWWESNRSEYRNKKDEKTPNK
jgi:hypothetical protein